MNISTSGVLLKINLRLMPGTKVFVNLEGTSQQPSIPAQVVRCNVSDIDSKGVLWYHVGADFTKPIVLEDGGAEPGNPRPVPVSAPARALDMPPAPSTSPALRNRW